MIVVYMLNTMHSMQKSYREVKKRRKALQQKKSFEESWHELQKMIASMSQHHAPQHHAHPAIDHQAHLRQHLFSSDQPTPAFGRMMTNQTTGEDADDHYYMYGNRSESVDSTTTAATGSPATISNINEFQFVIFILRHLRIIDDKKHIQPWIKVSF